MYEILVALHVLAGTVALSSFWVAALARKGSNPHRRAGRIHGQAMRAILLTAVPITVAVALRGNTAFAVFLGYLLMILTEGVWTGQRALRLKQQSARYYGRAYRAAAAGVFAAGALMLGYGLWLGNLLFAGFALVGLGRGAAMLRDARRPPSPRWALGEHLGAMVGNGAATHVAFLLLGLGRLLPASWAGPVQLFGWFAPLVLAVAAALWLERKYLRPQRTPALS